MKRIISLTLCVALLLCLGLRVFAADNGLTLQVTSTGNAEYVVDNANLLTSSEERTLSKLAEGISRSQHCDVVILTENSIGSKYAMDYADDYFDYNGYGYGPERSGILFLLAMEERDWWMSTRGDAIQAFTDDGLGYLWEKCGDDISDGNYYEGFTAYLNTANTMLSAYNGTLSEKELEMFQEDYDEYLGVASPSAVLVTSGNAGYVIDNADLLTSTEERTLTKLAEGISRTQHCDVVILTENSIGRKSAMDYADDYFDYNGYGYGPERSGILFLLAMEERDWWMSTRGEAIQVFTDDGLGYLWEKCGEAISDGNYYEGFTAYLNTANTMLSAYNGTLSQGELERFQEDYDEYMGESSPSAVFVSILSLIIGFLVAFIFSGSLRAQLKSVRMRYDATNYKRPNSMHMDRSRDQYLYAHTTTRVIETSRSSGGGGGGSSTHTSSSGASHGGRGGKF